MDRRSHILRCARLTSWRSEQGLALRRRRRDRFLFQEEEERVASNFERVRVIVAERLGVDEETITMDSEFIGDLNADSLDLVEVIMALEQEFGTEIKDEDAESIRTVGDAVVFIDERS